MAKNFTKETVLQAIEGSNGVMEYVALRLSCTWHCAREYVNKWEETKEAFEQAGCKLHMLAYKSFQEALANGEKWAIERVLDTSARRNGHGIVEHKQVDLSSSDGSMSPGGMTDEEFEKRLTELGIDLPE